MKNWMMGALFCGAVMATGVAAAQAVVGKAAPVFTVNDVTGKPVALADYKGRFVVLEWTNPDCPFVGKHYNSGSMPSTQKEAISKGVVWLSVQTTSKASRDDEVRAELLAWQKSKNAAPSATIVDSEGKLARSYRASTTPHMFVVDPQGTLVYAGAIDSKASTSPADLKTATNYVALALGEAMAGKPVSNPTTRAYGCAVKYPS